MSQQGFDERGASSSTPGLPGGENSKFPDPPAGLGPDGPEYILELIVDTLKQLDETAQGAFLQKFLRELASVDVSQKESIQHWEQTLARRGELARSLGRPVSLRTAAVDYFGEQLLLHNPILLEYRELKRLRHSASTDPLTGLNNRRMFNEHLEREINRSSRYGSSFSLLLMDLRRFKRANDTYGHAVGDEILRSVAHAFADTIRVSDVACRIGGDEFALLLPQADRPNAEALADRIARNFEKRSQALAPNTHVGMDVGVATFPSEGETVASLFDAADHALYANKQRAHQHEDQTPATLPILEPLPAQLPATGTASPELAAAPPAGTGKESVELTAPPAQAAEAPKLAHVPRRFERIPVESGQGLGVLRLEGGERIAQVLDLGLGGVCLLLEQATDVPKTFPASLRLPFLKETELTLHHVYSRLLPDGKHRMGCSFAPVSPVGQA